MANNGAAALSLIEPAPHVAPSNGAPASSPKPAIASDLEITIGEAVARGAVFISGAADDFRRNGILDPTHKEASATQIAAIATLALEHAGGDEDFFERARAAGRSVLLEYVTPGCSPQDRAIDFWIGGLLEIVTCVVKSERAFRAARAN